MDHLVATKFHQIHDILTQFKFTTFYQDLSLSTKRFPLRVSVRILRLCKWQDSKRQPKACWRVIPINDAKETDKPFQLQMALGV